MTHSTTLFSTLRGALPWFCLFWHWRVRIQCHRRTGSITGMHRATGKFPKLAKCFCTLLRWEGTLGRESFLPLCRSFFDCFLFTCRSFFRCCFFGCFLLCHTRVTDHHKVIIPTDPFSIRSLYLILNHVPGIISFIQKVREFYFARV
jgi:hypothetical protein